MPEQHRIGHDTEERGTGQQPGDGEHRRTVGFQPSRNETNDTRDGRDEIERRPEPLDAVTLAPDRLEEGETSRHDDGDARKIANRNEISSRSRYQRTERKSDRCHANQPPVTEANLTVTGRHPQEGKATRRPLKKHRGSVESDHVGLRYALDHVGAKPRHKLTCLMNAPSRFRPHLRGVLAMVVVGLLATGCMTGKRPTLGPVVDPSRPVSRQGTGDELVDKVLIPLEGLDGASFTLTYTVKPKSADTTPYQVIVTQTQPLSRAVAVGDALIITGTETVTCSVSGKTCLPGAVDANVIKPLTATFFDDGVKAQIRAAYSSRSSDPVGRGENILDNDAVCVTIPSKGDNDFCILPSGQLAKVDTKEINVELTSVSPEATPALFVRPDAA